MSFLSLNLNFTQRFPSDLGFVSNAFENLLTGIEHVFSSLASFVRKMSSLGQEIKESWEYYEDKETGLVLLRTEKGSSAIDKTRNALKDLFQ